MPPRGFAEQKLWFLQLVRDRVVRVPARLIARRVDLILAQNDSLILHLGTAGNKKLRVFPNVVVPSDLLQNSSCEIDDRLCVGMEEGAPQILAVGHFIPLKRFAVAIRALTHPSLRNARLHLVGSAINGRPNYLKTYAESMGVADRVTFHGTMKRTDVLRLMGSANVLFHPSGREGASGVVGEATSVGLPVVCFAGTGAASVLQESGSSGVVVNAANCDKDGDTIAAALLDAAALPHVRCALWSEERLSRLSEELFALGLKRGLASQTPSSSSQPPDGDADFVTT